MSILRLAPACACVLAFLGIARADALDTAFSVLTDESVVSGPPYPTAPHRIEVAHWESSSTEADGELALRLELALTEEEVIPAGLSVQEEQDVAGATSNLGVGVSCLDESGSPDPEMRAVLKIHAELRSDWGETARLVAVRSDLPFSDPLRFFDIATSPDSLSLRLLVEFSPGIRHGLALTGCADAASRLDGVEVVMVSGASRCRAAAGHRVEHGFFSETEDALFDVTFILQREVSCTDPPALALSLRGDFLSGPSRFEATRWGRLKSTFSN